VLSPQEQTAVEAHLRECPTCRAEVAFLRMLTAALAAYPEQEPPPGFAAQVRARLAAWTEPRADWRTWLRREWATALVGLGVAVGLGGGGMLLWQQYAGEWWPRAVEWTAQTLSPLAQIAAWKTALRETVALLAEGLVILRDWALLGWEQSGQWFHTFTHLALPLSWQLGLGLGLLIVLSLHWWEARGNLWAENQQL